MQHPGTYENLLTEAQFKATTSGGKGGQHVNKVATRIELYFDVNNSAFLSEVQKEMILRKLSGRISESGILRITSSEGRSQFDNKEKAKEKFLDLIIKALTPKTKRLPTHPGTEAKEQRLRKKKQQSEKKRMRGSWE